MLFRIETEKAKTVWLDALSRILTDKSESIGCRSSSAQGFANALCDVDRRSRPYRKAIKLLIAMLDDFSPDVRGSSALALGQLQEKKACAKLRYLVEKDHDKCIGPAHRLGNWTVSMEANEALKAIGG
jgi:HEAT repeats